MGILMKNRAVNAALSAVLVATLASGQGGWTPEPSMNLVRLGGASVGHGRWVYALGGNDLTTDHASFEMFDTLTGLWTLKPFPAGLTGRSFGRAVSLGGYVYFLGGHDAIVGHAVYAEVWRYDPSADTWSQRQSMLAPLINFGAAVLDGKIVVVGGRQPLWSHRNETYVFDPTLDYFGAPIPAWTQGPSFPGYALDLAPLGDCIAIAVKGGIVVQGAGADSPVTGASHAETWRLDLSCHADATWTQLNDAPHAIRAFENVYGHVFGLGGYERVSGTCTLFLDLVAFEPCQMAVRRVLPMPIHPAGSGVVDGRIYIFGGETTSQCSTGPFTTDCFSWQL